MRAKVVKVKATKVIFRVFRNGGVIALFSQVPGTSDPRTCESYMRRGQHGAAVPDGLILVRQTRLATPAEYAPLMRELQSEPYNYVLRVRARLHPSDYQTRRDQIMGI